MNVLCFRWKGRNHHWVSYPASQALRSRLQTGMLSVVGGIRLEHDKRMRTPIHSHRPIEEHGSTALAWRLVYGPKRQILYQMLQLFAVCAVPAVGKPFRSNMAIGTERASFFPVSMRTAGIIVAIIAALGLAVILIAPNVDLGVYGAQPWRSPVAALSWLLFLTASAYGCLRLATMGEQTCRVCARWEIWPRSALLVTATPVLIC